MATGLSTYSTVSTLINDIYNAAEYELTESNLLVRTVKTFGNVMGMAPRKVSQYDGANPREAGEGEDITPTILDRNLLATLTPARHADNFLLTDERVETDPQDVRADAAQILGSSFGQYVDTKIAGLFSSLTAGTVGSAGGTITWDNIADAYSILKDGKVPGPYWCALHPFHWNKLRKVAGSAIMVSAAPQFQDRLTSDYFMTSMFGDLYFVITANITKGTAAVGGMYSPMALAYDERKAFNIRPQRDESREAWELNASLWFAYGTWDAARGVQMIGTAASA